MKAYIVVESDGNTFKLPLDPSYISPNALPRPRPNPFVDSKPAASPFLPDRRDLRDRALALLAEGRTVNEVRLHLGLSYSSVYGWHQTAQQRARRAFLSGQIGDSK